MNILSKIPPKVWLFILLFVGAVGIFAAVRSGGSEAPEQQQRNAVSAETDELPTATFDGTPMNFAPFILPGTSTPTAIPTATPIIPIFRDGNYTVGVAEMQIRDTVTCAEPVFSNDGNSLRVTNLYGMTFTVTMAQHGKLDSNQDGWIAVDNAGGFGIGHDAAGWHTDWIGGCH